MEMLERNGRTEAIVLVMVARLQYLRFCLFEMYVNVVFVMRRLYSAVSLSLFREQRFIRIIIIILVVVVIIIIVFIVFRGEFHLAAVNLQKT